MGASDANAYDLAREEAMHRKAIEDLARECLQPPDAVRAVYERELLRLRDGAVVSTYLALFAQRRARAMLARNLHTR